VARCALESRLILGVSIAALLAGASGYRRSITTPAYGFMGPTLQSGKLGPTP